MVTYDVYKWVKEPDCVHLIPYLVAADLDFNTAKQVGAAVRKGGHEVGLDRSDSNIPSAKEMREICG